MFFRRPNDAAADAAAGIDAETAEAIALAERRRQLRRRRDMRIAAVTQSLKERILRQLRSAQKHPWVQIKDTIITVLYYTVAAMLYACVLSVASFVIYSILYLIYIPTAEHTFPIHLQFAPYGDAALPTTVFPLVPTGKASRLLSRHHGYNIDFSLAMPESEPNVRSGMFMVSLALASSRDAAERALHDTMRISSEKGCAAGGNDCDTTTDAAVAISRAAVLRHRSWLLSCFRTTIFVVPMLVGLLEESQRVDVPLFRNVPDNTTTPYTWAAVGLSEPNVQLYWAEIRFHAHFTGASYIMHDWFYSSYVMGVSLTAVGLVTTNVLALVAYYYYCERAARLRSEDRHPHEEMEMDDFGPDDMQPADEETLDAFGEAAEEIADDSVGDPGEWDDNAAVGHAGGPHVAEEWDSDDDDGYGAPIRYHTADTGAGAETEWVEEPPTAMTPLLRRRRQPEPEYGPH
eukprot:m.115783 g.115783  ORF g.115783 m.115783 type:complete len:460 (+) comp21585_c0_seq1:201-1580(+)